MASHKVCACNDLSVKFSGFTPSQGMLKKRKTAAVQAFRTSNSCYLNVTYTCGSRDGCQILVGVHLCVLYDMFIFVTFYCACHATCLVRCTAEIDYSYCICALFVLAKKEQQVLNKKIDQF